MRTAQQALETVRDLKEINMAAKSIKFYTTKTLAEKAGTTTEVVRNAIDNGVIKNVTKNESRRLIIPVAEGNKFIRAFKSKNKPVTTHTVTVSGAAKWAGKSTDTIRYHVKKGHVRSLVGRNGLQRVFVSDVVKVFNLGKNKGKTTQAK